MEAHITTKINWENIPVDTDVYKKSQSEHLLKSGDGETKEPFLSPERQTDQKTIRLTVASALSMSLENNPSLMVERLSPEIRQTYEENERALFDPIFSGEVSVTQERDFSVSGSDVYGASADEIPAVISLSQYFPSGATAEITAGLSMDYDSSDVERFFSSRVGLKVVQPLYRGAGANVNTVGLKQAVVDTRMSEYELRGFVESLTAEVENTYWDYALAERQIEIVKESLDVAVLQQRETEDLVSFGRLAASEIAAIRAEVAKRELDLIDAESEKEILRLKLIGYISPGTPRYWDREVELLLRPVLPVKTPEDVMTYVSHALQSKPLLNEARLNIKRGDLELIKTKNGLLPLVDFFVALGKSGYASSFGTSLNLFRDGYDISAGVGFSYPLYNRDAKADHRRAGKTAEQTRAALRNLEHLVEMDVRTAYIHVNRTKRRIKATTATRIQEEEKLRVETEKLKVGKSTGFIVAQAQRDLLAGRIAEVKALTDYLKALIQLYLADGSLLERRGIVAPGSEG